MEEAPHHIKIGLKIVSTIICAVVLFLGGVYVGYQNRPAMAKVVDVVHKEVPASVADQTDFATFWKAWTIAEEKFPGADKTSAQDRMYGAIKGMLASFGDPYTTFFPPAENEAFTTQIAGEFSGIGVEIGEKDGILTVIAPLKGTPAEKAGLKAGDKIVKIDDKITADFDIDHAIELIRGTVGTPVVLTIVREGEQNPLTFTLKRATISLPTVDTSSKNGVFIISLYNFSQHSASLFRDAFQKYLDSGDSKLIIDLRGNPGGYLDAAVDIASLFLPEGDVVVKEIGKSPTDVTVHTTHGKPLFPKNNQLIILVDKGSASASEILAGALSEHNIGTLVGTQTFGKGSVQQVINLTPDTSMKVTVAKWYTPNGISISDSGLTPKVKVEQGKDTSVDTQLEEAIKLFK